MHACIFPYTFPHRISLNTHITSCNYNFHLNSVIMNNIQGLLYLSLVERMKAIKYLNE